MHSGYTASCDGSAEGVAQVVTGGTGSDVEGRAVVVHGYDGGRIACALLSPLPASLPAKAADFVKYFEYQGELVSNLARACIASLRLLTAAADFLPRVSLS